jgi:hypothetical protein
MDQSKVGQIENKALISVPAFLIFSTPSADKIVPL